jgi:hypothetical protein
MEGTVWEKGGERLTFFAEYDMMKRNENPQKAALFGKKED